MCRSGAPSRARIITILLFAVSFACRAKAGSEPRQIEEVYKAFVYPPDNARIMMRWWWFGPGVTKPELDRELQVMKTNGIGGVEIQPVYPLALNDPQTGFRNLPYLSDGFIDALHFAANRARELGMRVDITLGSGWPYGGPETPITKAAGHLRYERVAVPAGAASIPVPSITSGEKFIAAFLVEGESASFQLSKMQRLAPIQTPRLSLPAGLNGPHTVLFFISSRTGMQVKRAGVGAEGFVLDHYDRSAIENHLTHTGNRLMEAFGAHPPYAVFSDSLEVFASDWTGDLLEEFKKRRGYDLTPYLPALVGDIGPDTAAIRHDWGQTLTELANERYLTPIREWAHAHHTLFRSQTYGVPPVVLSSNALVDLPEGEAGPHWRQFSPARWAASASHLYERPVTSTETWTWLHSPAFRATPLDLKAEADLHFLQGINQLIGHGWPYSPPFAGEPGWRFYAAAALNEHNPWFPVMPDLTKYLQRMSFLLRQGAQANDVAVYLPTDDAWAGFTAGRVSVDRSMDALLGDELIPQILNAGYNFDFIDDGAIASTSIPYRVVILPGVERISPNTLRRLQEFVQKGGIVVATRRLPSVAPGFKDAGEITRQVQGLVHTLFNGAEAHAKFVRDERTLGQALTQLTPPDFAVTSSQSAMGFIHRKLPSADIYFLANTSNQSVNTTATVRVSNVPAEWWNPFNGKEEPMDYRAGNNGTIVPLQLAPYESRVLVFSRQQVEPSGKHAFSAHPLEIQLSAPWNVTFSSLHKTMQLDGHQSWADNEATRFYSGTAAYEQTVSVPAAFTNSGVRAFLDFGRGTPTEPAAKGAPGMHALLESPVREAAVVFVNGQKAGTVWHPPYQVEVTGLLHKDANQIRIVVGNTAINELAGEAPESYRLLNLRYGERFTPQDMKNLKPLPSGILEGVRLVAK